MSPFGLMDTLATTPVVVAPLVPSSVRVQGVVVAEARGAAKGSVAMARAAEAAITTPVTPIRLAIDAYARRNETNASYVCVLPA